MILIWTFGLGTRQHSLYKKDLDNANILRPSYCELSLHLVQALDFVWIHLQHCLGANCYFDLVFDALVWVDQGIFHLIHEKITKTASYWNACLDIMAIFIWCLGLHMVCLDIAYACCLLKSKGKWVSIWHSCVLDCIPLVRSFQLLTFNFYLG